MDARLYRTDFRPVQLVEHYVLRDKVRAAGRRAEL